VPTTPNRGWVYPSLGQNPYYTTIETFFLAQDADVHNLAGGAILTGTWVYSTNTTMADPGSGSCRVNTATIQTATILLLDRLTDANTDATPFIMSMVTGDVLYLQQRTDASIWVRYRLTAGPVNQGPGNYFELAVTVVASAGGAIAGNTKLLVMAEHGGGNIPVSLVDAKGDLIAATAADSVTRLAVGSNRAALVADSAQTTGMGWITQPYRTSLVGVSSTVSNTTASTAFNKVLTIPAGVLNVAGAEFLMRLRVCGASNLASPGYMILDTGIGAKRLGVGAANLLASTGLYEVSMIVSGQIRATGTSGTMMSGPGFIGVGNAVDTRAITDSAGAVQSIGDLTTALTTTITVQFSVADVSVSAYLNYLTVEVTYPDATVS